MKVSVFRLVDINLIYMHHVVDFFFYISPESAAFAAEIYNLHKSICMLPIREHKI